MDSKELYYSLRSSVVSSRNKPSTRLLHRIANNVEIEEWEQFLRDNEKLSSIELSEAEKDLVNDVESTGTWVIGF